MRKTYPLGQQIAWIEARAALHKDTLERPETSGVSIWRNEWVMCQSVLATLRAAEQVATQALRVPEPEGGVYTPRYAHELRGNKVF